MYLWCSSYCIFPYFPTTVNKHTPRLLSLTEVTYKKPPPKQKVVEKIKAKPKPKRIETPPQEIEEPEPEPTEAFEYRAILNSIQSCHSTWLARDLYLEIQILTDGTVGTGVLLKLLEESY